jgi:O-acetyl-ADP-ribose deacetylase (regulator of RNase III)
MIQEVNANLLEFPNIEGFIHSCNCYHTMGSGIAAQIKKKYPELYEADTKSGQRGDARRLGTFSFAKLSDGKVGYNLYSQHGFGRNGRFTLYDAMVNGLEKIEEDALERGLKSIGVPKNIGCVLGGGSWTIVRAILEDVFGESTLDLYICNYTPR